MKECCANCYHVVKVSGSDKYRCWEEPSVCDYPRIFTAQEAQEYSCSEYLFYKKKFCRDCRYFGGDYCKHKKTVAINGNFVVIRHVGDMRRSCDLFDEKEREDD